MIVPDRYVFFRMSIDLKDWLDLDTSWEENRLLRWDDDDVITSWGT
jgi:hypothetical protein